MKSFTMYKLFILCSFLLTIIHHVSSTSLPYFMRSVENPHPDFSFSKMVRYSPTGYLYVGATNYLYKISPNLTIEIEKKIGPELDNPNCIHLDQNCLQKTMHDSYIKAMVIADSENVLIVCTSLFQGRCWKRHLSNLTRSGDDIETPVVANNKTATTVIFIAPGPSDSGVRNVMYVGASWTNTGLKAVRDLVPAFSSRQIWNFSYTFGNFYRKSYMKLDEPHRDSFPIWYIYGFSSNNFSYMATIQKRDTHAENFISKLIRVCQNDSKFYSYAESELRCSYNGNVYNLLQAAYVGKPGSLLAKSLKIPSSEDVLFGMFALGTPNAFTPPKESVLCIFPMWEVIKVFTLNIKKCFEGIGNIGPDHLVNPTNCQESEYSSTIDDNYCGAYRIDNPINGPDPVQAEAYLAIKDSSSSLIVTSPDMYTVAFVGTITGHIKKIAIESRTEMRQYEDLTVEQGFKIHQDMHLDTDEQHLYLLTDNKLHKIAVQNCSQYTDCASCTGARDPYCGWCSLEKKCSLKTECARNDEPLRWLGYHGESCTNITAVVPDKIQKDNKQSKATTLSLNITNLPSYNGPYKCAFTGYGSHFETPARREGPDLITCDTPAPNELPRFQTGEDHIIMKLSVVINGSDFVSTNFTFFDCEVHSQDSCYKCTASIFNCTWCIKNHHCSHYPLEDCSANDVFVSGQNSAGLSIPHTPGPPSCPRIEASTTLILIPSGNTKNVTVSGVNLRDFQTPIRCYFSLNSGKTVNAHYGKMGNNKDLSFIVCNEVEFFYPEDTKYWNVPFKILWGDKNPKPLDNPDNMQVKMYKCEKMANSCGECLTQRSLYTCGWCGGQENKCSLKSSCDKKENWLSYLQNCPNPIIHSIQPTSGPKEGGTLLTIKGKDLGKTYQDIVSNVDIAGVQCSPIRDDYVASVRIVCITGRMLIDGERSGHVRVTVAQEYTATSYQKFTYVNPAIQGRSPEQGPVSGGTEITLYGSDMNAGTQRKVFFKNNYGIEDHECKIIKESVTASQLKCVTSKVNNTGRTGYLYMTFDKQTVYSTLHFEYIKDPNITKVQRKMAIVSGGIQVIAEGTGLSTIQRPKIILYYGTTVYEGDCMTRNDTLLECSSPQLDSYIIPATKYDSGIQLHFGFILDNVEEVRNLSRRPSFGNFTIYPDPDFTQFPGKVKSIQKKTEFLIIGGNYLNKGVMQQDIKVRIGKGTCNITNYGTQLTCRPPKDQPASLRNSRYPEVEIDVGNNLTIFIGYLRYEETEFPLPLEYIILICAGGGVLLISVVVVIIMYTMKTKKNDSMMKRMQIQMDNLEAKVAKECKEAFAELQTDMTELTSDLYGQVAIPFWDYRTYCMRVLFPQEQDTDHPVIKDLEVDYSRRDSVEKGLKLFSQLINNKTFLLIFVRTLEGHKQFTMRDRVNVASLISVALQTKMEYATDILKTLLAELIEKSVEGKNHPKLLLRRTESVAEKMLTNWFTFLLYKFLRECAGDPLFMLYQAIKHQVAKGPVDSCTSEARYSLSEDKLIRQQLDYRQMTIYVQDMDQFGQSPHPVKVLDCDTISQVKEKILDAMYKNAPFSSRPVKEDVDLVLLDQCTPNNTEWNSGIKGRLILQDDDNTTRVEGEYKRMNTLAHYKVPDSAFMTLVPKQPPSYNSLSLTSSEKSTSRFYVPEKFLPHHTRSPSFQRTVAPQGVHVDIVDNYGVKYYHLVKQHDNETNREGDRGSKMVSEIYLTRLLATKGTLQQFVDDLFERIFSTAHRGTALPLAIKYMFDFLDDQALLHNIMEADVVHTWKSNSLPLRFWVNVIKNPNFVFDIYKSNIVDSCLSVVAQTFMDSCSMSEHRLGKDSPSSKLLYAKDIPKYKKWVERYYQDIKMMPAISDQDMTAMMAEESRQHSDEFNTTASLYELYKYVQKYSSDLFSALEDDEFAKKNRLTYKLEQVRVAMESELYC